MEEQDAAVREHIRENVLVPLMKMMPRVIKGLKEFNIHFPIQKIAYLEMHGDLVVEGLEGFREELLAYLEGGYRFKKYYWEFIQRSYKLFDREMKKDGSFIPGYKYYQALRIDMYLALFGQEGETWCARFDDYIGKIRERAGGSEPAPRTGREFLNDGGSLMEIPVRKIKQRQKKLLKKSRIMNRRVKELYRDAEEQMETARGESPEEKDTVSGEKGG